MTRIFIFFIVLFCGIFSFAKETKYVNANVLNARSGAGTQYDVIEKIKMNDKVEVLSSNGEWAEIELKNGVKGFVNTKFLSDTKKENSGATKKKSLSLAEIFLGVIAGILTIVALIKDTFKKLFGSSDGNNKTDTKAAEVKPEIKKEVVMPIQENVKVVKPQYACKCCGYLYDSLERLVSDSCSLSPTKHHQPLEGGVKDIYFCKYCGMQHKNLSILVYSSCYKSPTKKHQPFY